MRLKGLAYSRMMKLTQFCALILVLLSASGHSRQIDVVVGYNKPPYVTSYNHKGFELELVSDILTARGHTLMPLYVPMGRISRLVEKGIGDIGLTQTDKQLIPSEQLSDVYVIYQNVAISLAERKLSIKRPLDLKHYSIIGFQTARKALGEEFALAVENHPSYLEMPQQQRQVSMLMQGNVDVLVMDRNIFNHMKSKLPDQQQKPVVIHELFGVTPYRAAIPDPELRAEFNQELASMIKDGRYQALLKRYDLVEVLPFTHPAGGDGPPPERH